MRIITFVFILMLTFAGLQADEAATYDEAMALAAKLKKPVLIDFWSDN